MGIHKSSGEVLRKKPRCLTKQTSGLVEIEVQRPVCMELYKDYRELGRFMLRAGGATIAAGLVTKVNQSINQSIKQSNKQTSKQANKQTNKQTNKQASKTKQNKTK